MRWKVPEATAPVANVLTDGTGVSPITGQKLLKDFVYDLIVGSIAGFATSSYAGVQDVIAAPLPIVFGIANAAIAAIVRIALRWASN